MHSGVCQAAMGIPRRFSDEESAVSDIIPSDLLPGPRNALNFVSPPPVFYPLDSLPHLFVVLIGVLHNQRNSPI
jgi:hypothetical protein